MSTLLATVGTIGVSLPIYSCEDSWDTQYDTAGNLKSDSLTRTLIIPYDASNWRAYVPGYLSPLPEAPWMVLTKTKCQQVSNDPRRAKVTLTYEQDTVSFDPATAGASLNPGSTPSNGTNTYQKLPEAYGEENGSLVSKGILENPKFNTTDALFDGNAPADYWDPALGAFEADAPAELSRISEYFVGSFTVTWHDFSWVKLSDPRDIVGKLSVPPGYSGAAKNWLVISGYRSRQQGYWRRSLVYRYDPDPADAVTFFYDTAA